VLSLPLGKEDRPLHLLAIGAHCDDIEIGAGGTILSVLAARPVELHWVILTSTPERRAEALASAAAFRAGAGGATIVYEFRDGFLPYEGPAVKEAFEALKDLPAPDVIFTHYRGDLHQDHRLVSELTWNTFRDHLIFEYEIPKYDADLGHPNVFVPLEDGTLRRKWELLWESFPSQRGRRWFTEETIRALARVRGIESGTSAGFAEGFHSRKAVISTAMFSDQRTASGSLRSAVRARQSAIGPR
jgi:LmbE family N-acetylglucosaminyl deacetylase